MMKLVHVVGARPNFMKVTPVWRAISKRLSTRQILVHTGQHYDVNMSEVFFTDLGLPEPDHYLDVGSGSHAEQTASIMTGFHGVVSRVKPDLVLVYGDVNSTVAAALVCAKLLIPVGHVEAGLRSLDRTMPEEINRLLTDQISDLLFTPSSDGNENLIREGVNPAKIHLVGNVMIDTLVQLLPKAKDPGSFGLPEKYALVTLHRPSNVDDLTMLRRIVEMLAQISERLKVVFPIHPRTRQRIADFDLRLPGSESFQLREPMGYLGFISLLQSSTVAITDSGGIQEETTFLGVPCLTLRENTERPVTVTDGTNQLVGKDMNLLCRKVDQILEGDQKEGKIPPLWDGHSAERIANVLHDFLN
ncbi:MAG: UDP-N-acetylglucosamine 2-epimerase (non-hydrolyzing) [Candidatus Neomarinimicrobiota bacterium]